MPRDFSILSDRMQRLLADEVSRNLHAQAHARAILFQLDTPRSRWPSFRPDLDERLSYSADLMLCHGVDLIESGEHDALGYELLKRGAEAIEYARGLKIALDPATNELLKAAIAYQISGHHSRAYVILQRLETSQALAEDRFSNLVIALLQGNLTLAWELTFEYFDDREQTGGPSETSVASPIELDDDEVIAALGRTSLAQALSHYLMYLKTGDETLLEESIITCGGVAALGIEARHADLWWWGRAIATLLRRIGDSGVWRNLSDLGPVLPWGPASQPYIESHVARNPAIVSLWPSQLRALNLIKDEARPSFCIRMPTSAGKTKIAELAIVETLLRQMDLDTKCIYIAPFRSLAAELEKTLGTALSPLGIRVSEIYGGYDFTPADRNLVGEVQVLISTPEKLDAVIRLAPEVLDGVRLVVFDEGQITGEVSDRGLRAEFLVNRLLYRLGRKQCRHVFISAVLPNPDEFAQWIGGDTEQKAESEWRPTRLMFGECQWNGTRIRLEYSHEGTTRLEDRVFVPNFVRKTKVQGLSGFGRRRNPFPANAREAFAAAAIRLTAHGTTLVFVPQARHVLSVAKQIESAHQNLQAIARATGVVPDSFSPPDPTTELMEQCLEAIGDELGEDSDLARLVQAGIAVHHGRLPSRVRLAMENLVRAEECRLIVATTTLGQGINLPIRTVLVRGVQQGRGVSINPTAFWNIAGRAGRAMTENEGHVLFFVDQTASNARHLRHVARGLIEQSEVAVVISLLHRALSYLRRVWKHRAPDINFEQLCMRLAENDFDWAPNERPQLRIIFDLVDQHLLAVALENELAPEDSDQLQEILRDSLLFVQLDSRPIPALDKQAATAILSARLASIRARVPDERRRKQFYRMGFELKDCSLVEANLEVICRNVQRTADWNNLDDEQRMSLLSEMAELALTLAAAGVPDDAGPPDLLPVVRAWLQGLSCVQMIEAGIGSEVADDAEELSRIIESVCVYGLSWVITGFVSFASAELELQKLETPDTAWLLPSLFKYGLKSPEAAVLAPLVGQDRFLSNQLAAVCPHGHQRIDKMTAWFHEVSRDTLVSHGMDIVDANRVARYQRPIYWTFLENPAGPVDVRRVRFASTALQQLGPGSPLILRRDAPRSSRYRLLTLEGQAIGTFRAKKSQPLPDWIDDAVRVHTVIADVSEPDDDGRVRVTIESRELMKG